MKFHFVVIALILVSCSSCIKNTRILERGYLPQEEIKIGINQKSVEKDYGVPAFKDGGNWYYVKIQVKEDNLAINKYYDAKVIKITFDNHNKVEHIDKSLVKNKIPARLVKHSDLDKKGELSTSIVDLLKHLQPTF